VSHLLDGVDHGAVPLQLQHPNQSNNPVI
jgi:hypothetical protein